MRSDRRRYLALAPAAAGLLLSSSFAPLLAARARRLPAALLLPLSGPSAPLGLTMQRAAVMAQPAGVDAELTIYDSGGTPEGARRAATLALKAGARLLLGPLLATEARAALAVTAGRVPLLCFSNDESLRDSGAFVLGVTASQSVAAVLSYCRRRGVRRVALLRGDGTAWDTQATAAAQVAGAELGLELTSLADTGSAALRRETADAVLVTGGRAALATAAGALQGSGVQLLGTPQALGEGPPLAVGASAWIAAPDPAAFADFARRYEERNGGTPGALAALAYDGATIVRLLREAGSLDRAALLRPSGFPGVAGAVRFREDGSATRALAVLVVEGGDYTVAPS